MSKQFPLQNLLDLSHTLTDSAARKLGKINAHKMEVEKRLEMLLQYRRDYQAKFEQSVKSGLPQEGWRNFREFMEKLDAAIAQQKKAMHLAIEQTKQGELEWLNEKRKQQSYDTLSHRHTQAEARRNARHAQRDQDELAARSHLAKTASATQD